MAKVIRRPGPGRRKPEAVLGNGAWVDLSLLELARDAIVLRNLDRIVYCNPRAKELYGWSREEAVGARSAHLFDTLYSEPEEQVERQLRTGGHWEGRLERRRRGGGHIGVHARLVWQGELGDEGETILEISHSADGGGGHSDLLGRLWSEVEGLALFMLDADGRVASWSKEAERVTGYRAGDVIGQHCSLLYLPSDVCFGKPEQELALAAVEGRYLAEERRRRRDGSSWLAHVLIARLLDGVDGLLGFCSLLHDLTPFEGANRDATPPKRRELSESPGFDFLGGQDGWRLREQIAVLSGYLSVLACSPQSLGPVGGRAVALLAARVQKLCRLLDLATRLAQLEAGVSHPGNKRLEATRLVASAIVETRAYVTSAAVPVVRLPMGELWVETDPGGLRAIVEGLLHEALDTCEEGARVTWDLDSNGPLARLVLDCSRRSRPLEGIARESGLHDDKRYRGLRLALVGELARMLGGQITIKADRDGWRRLTFVLRLAG